MAPFKMILGDKFVEGLMAAGIADERTQRVVIDAEVGEPVKVYIQKIGDERLVALLDGGGIVVTNDSESAVCR